MNSNDPNIQIEKPIQDMVRAWRESSGFKRATKVVEPPEFCDMAGSFVIVRRLTMPEWKSVMKLQADKPEEATALVLKCILHQSPSDLLEELPAFGQLVANSIAKFSGFSNDDPNAWNG